MFAARFLRFVVLLAAATFLPTFAAAQNAPSSPDAATVSTDKSGKSDKTVKVAAKRPFRGVWVSTVGNIDYPSKPGLSADQLRAEADALLDRAAELR